MKIVGKINFIWKIFEYQSNDTNYAQYIQDFVAQFFSQNSI
jgi:hypothetical protein